MLDRIDLHVDVPRLPYEKMAHAQPAGSSLSIKKRVAAARKIQAQRFKSSKTNSEMNLVELKQYCRLEKTEEEVLKNAMKKYNFSGRSLHRILKVSTIADWLAWKSSVSQNLGEALMYRPKTE